MKPLEISQKTATGIIENREPKGLFYFKENNNFIGIDNSTGDSFVEEFKDEKTCIAWLENQDIIYHTESDFGKSLKDLKGEQPWLEKQNKKSINSFEVIITEELVTSIIINAETKEKAINIAKDRYDKEDIVLDYDDFNDVNFKADYS